MAMAPFPTIFARGQTVGQQVTKEFVARLCRPVGIMPPEVTMPRFSIAEMMGSVVGQCLFALVAGSLGAAIARRFEKGRVRSVTDDAP
jgi:hypothetical protein